MRLNDLVNAEVYSETLKQAKAVIIAYQNANRWADSVQEYVLMRFGMPTLAKIIHEQAHLFPARFDEFVDMLHERHLMATYGATEELDVADAIDELPKVFEFMICLHDLIAKELVAFQRVAKEEGLPAMAIKTDNFITQNSTDCTKYFEMWEMWENSNKSLVSFDNWCKRYLDD